MPKSIKLLLTLAAIGVIGALLWGLLPGRGFDTELAKLGQGRPALVLAFESYSPAGAETMELLSKVRGEYAPRIDFLVADLGTPSGRAFASTHALRDGMVVLIGAEGRAAGAGVFPGSEAELRRNLDRHLGRFAGDATGPDARVFHAAEFNAAIALWAPPSESRERE